MEKRKLGILLACVGLALILCLVYAGRETAGPSAVGLPVCLKRKRRTHRTTRQSFSLSGAYSLSFFSMSRKYL